MHEFSLYGQIRKEDHHRMLQQLAGFTRMQPQDAREIHLVFKARQPPGLDLVQSIGASNLASQQQQDIQRVKGMLNAGIYYVRLIGTVQNHKEVKGEENGDVVMQDSGPVAKSENTAVGWTLEFKDTPEAGKQAVSSRLLSRTPMEGTNLVQFLESFGFEYTSRYMVVGSRFYENDTTIFVHRVLRLPRVAAEEAISDQAYKTNIGELSELDGSGGFIVQASIETVDGNNSELKDRATRQLLGIKEALKQAVDLTPGDRLALDTRLPANSRRT